MLQDFQACSGELTDWTRVVGTSASGMGYQRLPLWKRSTSRFLPVSLGASVTATSSCACTTGYSGRSGYWSALCCNRHQSVIDFPITPSDRFLRVAYLPPGNLKKKSVEALPPRQWLICVSFQSWRRWYPFLPLSAHSRYPASKIPPLTVWLCCQCQYSFPKSDSLFSGRYHKQLWGKFIQVSVHSSRCHAFHHLLLLQTNTYTLHSSYSDYNVGLATVVKWGEHAFSVFFEVSDTNGQSYSVDIAWYLCLFELQTALHMVFQTRIYCQKNFFRALQYW